MRPAWKATSVVLFATCLLFGGVFGDRLLALNSQARESLQLYTELLQVARESYAGEVTYRDLVTASIEGMVRTLDPHTNFLSAEAYSGMRDRQRSSFHGLGILIGIRNRQLTVITPIDGTPAKRMGIRAGDVITAIEGDPTEAMSINEAVRRLKGPKGTTVEITIVRPGLDDPLELTIERDEIPQTTVRYVHMMTPEIGYMTISDFNRGTGREVSEALAKLRQEGMQGLLIDLRSNGGGLLDQAIEVVELFVPRGAKIVETRGRTRNSFQQYRASQDRADPDLPLVILVGEGTASAAEILAGAIQDHDIGLIVGTPTWGKGLVQTVYSLSYGSGLALTTAKYYTPSGRLIQRDYSSWYDYANPTGDPAGGIEAEGEAVQAYLTDLGRKVYGGGGIEPDIRVEPQELSTFIQYLMSRNAFFDFAVESVNGHPIETPDWAPSEEKLEQFRAWLVEQSLATEEEVDEGLSGQGQSDVALRFIEAEIKSASFGIEERFKTLAKDDPQTQKALTIFDQARELLAQRQQLEESPDRTSSLGLSN